MKNRLFCATPFLQLHLGLNGEVTPCCWGREIVVGQATQQSLLEIWNGPAMRSLRREFLTGEVKTCAKRIAQRQCHQYHIGAAEDIERSEIQSHPPQMLHTRLSGLCNLQCEMCEIWKRPENPYEESDLWTLGKAKIFPFLRRITVVGGEPFVQESTFRLIEQVADVNSTCKWTLVTNGQWKFSAKIEEALDRIRCGTIVVSVDSLNPEVYRQIRSGKRLEVCLRAIDDLIAYSQKRFMKTQSRLVIQASLTVQKQNWQEIPSFYKYWSAKGLRTYFGPLYQPSHLSLQSLTETERSFAMQEIGNWLFDTKEESLYSILKLLAAKPIDGFTKTEWEGESPAGL